MLYLFSYINDDKLSTKVVTVGRITYKCMGLIECDKYEWPIFPWSEKHFIVLVKLNTSKANTTIQICIHRSLITIFNKKR
jgi:hypothetical protein